MSGFDPDAVAPEGAGQTRLERLGAVVAGATAASFAPERAALQRRHLLDAVAAGVAGAFTEEAAHVRRLLGCGTPAARAGVAAAAIRLSELDDIHLRSCTTPSAIAVGTALALAERRPQPCEDGALAASIAAGTEIVTRLGEAVAGPTILYRGIWPSYLTAPIGAAATAARLSGLDARRTAHALSLALMASTGGVGRFRGDGAARFLLFANGVAGGVLAAEAAAAGLTGDLDLLEGDWLAATHGIDLDPGPLDSMASCGEVYGELSLKPYCTARQALAAAEAFDQLMARDGLAPDRILEVEARVPPLYARMISARPEAGHRSSGVVSAPFQLALAALRPNERWRLDRTGLLADPALLDFSSRVRVVGDERLAARFPQAWPAEIVVRTSGGELRRTVTVAAGDPARPLSDDDVASKAHRVLDPLVGPEAADLWVDTCRAALEDETACRRLPVAFMATCVATSSPTE